MTVKQHINYGAIQKVCHSHDGIFHSINRCHTFSILLYHLSCVIHLKQQTLLYHLSCVIHLKQQTMEREKRRVFLYMAASAYHVISKEVENCVFRHNHIFRRTFMYKQPILTR